MSTPTPEDRVEADQLRELQRETLVLLAAWIHAGLLPRSEEEIAVCLIRRIDAALNHPG